MMENIIIKPILYWHYPWILLSINRCLLGLILKYNRSLYQFVNMISRHKDRSHLESGQTHYHLKKKSARKAPKDPSLGLNIEKFLKHLKTQNLRTERYTSPNRRFDRKHTDSSKSKKLIKSFESNRSYKELASREKSNSAFKQTNRDKKPKPLKPMAGNISKILKIQHGIGFSDLVNQIYTKIEEAEKLLQNSKEKSSLQDLIRRFKDIISSLLKSMVTQIKTNTIEKENQLLEFIDNGAVLESDILEQEERMQRLEYQRNLYKRELESSDRIIQKQNNYIKELKTKNNKVNKLIYCLRKKGIDIDKLYMQEVEGQGEDQDVQESRHISIRSSESQDF